MSSVWKDRVRETTTTTGTGAITLDGAATGFRAFSTIGNGNQCYYVIDDNAGKWEVGQGIYSSSGNSLSRDTVLSSSNSGSLVNFGAGSKTVRLDVPATFFTSIPDSSLAAFVGTANITTLGTIGTGTWNATVISKAKGGTGEDNSTGGTANTFWARPNGATGAASYRAIVAADVPTLNQNTSGSAATLTTPRAIYGNNFDGSAALTQIIASTYGGTGNGFTAFTGPTTSEKTFTLPNASATILTSNAVVTVAQGGIGVGTLASNGVLYGNGTSAVQALAVNSTVTNKFLTQSSSGAPAWNAIVAGDISGLAVTWTGLQIIAPTARSSGSASWWAAQTPADTSLTASTESIGMQHGGNSSAATVTRQWATGALTTQRENLFVAPTYAFVGISTLTTAVNVEAASPIQGTNATLTNSYAARFIASAATHVPLVAKGAGSQTGFLTDWQDSTGASLARVLTNGSFETLAPRISLSPGSGGGGTAWIVASNPLGSDNAALTFRNNDRSAIDTLGTQSGIAFFLYFGVTNRSGIGLGYGTEGITTQPCLRSGTPTDGFIVGTGGSGTDINGGDVNIKAGPPTGSGVSGSINLQVSGAAGASASTLRAVTTNAISVTGGDAKGKVGFFTTAPVVQQTRGATLTNSVTAGGVDDTIADFTNLTTYSTDAATIRNDIYQLARILRQHDVALRALGLMT